MDQKITAGQGCIGKNRLVELGIGRGHNRSSVL